MNIHDIDRLFEKHEDEYLKFDRVNPKHSKRCDVHAFVLLDRLFPVNPGIHGDLITCAEHDQFWIGLEPSEIEQLTEEHVIELRRCGVSFDSHNEALFMFT